jgi:hypothetical protein
MAAAGVAAAGVAAAGVAADGTAEDGAPSVRVSGAVVDGAPGLSGAGADGVDIPGGWRDALVCAGAAETVLSRIRRESGAVVEVFIAGTFY